MTVAGLPVRERFEMYVHPEPNTGCFIWAGALDPHGYGALRVKRVTQKAHRMAYEFYCGAVPDELSVLHKCDVRCCVNPDHLFIGTRADNLKDMWAKGRGKASPNGEAARNVKLTEAQVLEIRASMAQHKQLAAMYGVDSKTIRSIRKRQTWKHI